MPQNAKEANIDIEYCNAWGGLPEANYAKKIISHVYPNSKVNIFSPGKTGLLKISANGS